eukprot:10400955-Alexandrium_andersonii.AAC.1
MSASLVGSEMCIRDSATAWYFRPAEHVRGEPRARLPIGSRQRTSAHQTCLLYTSDAADDM